MSPKITKRTPRVDRWNDPGRDDPGHDLNQPHNGKGRKNTKRWCKGKVGREHDYRLAEEYRSNWFNWFNYDLLVCRLCGKHNLRSVKP